MSRTTRPIRNVTGLTDGDPRRIRRTRYAALRQSEGARTTARKQAIAESAAL